MSECFEVRGLPSDDWPGAGMFEWGMGSRVTTDDGKVGIVCGAINVYMPGLWLISVRVDGELLSYRPEQLSLGEK